MTTADRGAMPMPRSIAREREAFARWRDAHATRTTSPTRERRDDAREGDGRFERAADYLAHYLKRSRRRASEDYEAYCLCMCERARDERDARGGVLLLRRARAGGRAGGAARRGDEGEGERARGRRAGSSSIYGCGG